jgi:hypothetical protein
MKSCASARRFGLLHDMVVRIMRSTMGASALALSLFLVCWLVALHGPLVAVVGRIIDIRATCACSASSATDFFAAHNR